MRCGLVQSVFPLMRALQKQKQCVVWCYLSDVSAKQRLDASRAGIEHVLSFNLVHCCCPSFYQFFSTSTSSLLLLCLQWLNESSADVQNVLAVTLERLQQLGATIVDVSLPDLEQIQVGFVTCYVTK
jgi:hypothetical protein